VVREFRVLDLLTRAEQPVRVPRPVAVCEDPDVLGAPFYLMEQVEGVVVRDTLPGWLDEPARRALGLDLATAFAELHLVAIEPFVAAGLGRPDGYLARQLRRWTGQREGIQAAVAAAGGRARDLPDYDAVRDWLVAHLPAEAEPAVVHGDAKLDNVVVGPGETPAVAAVLDWEMATVGDPRADLGYLLSFWPEPEVEGSSAAHPLAQLVTAGAGFPSRDELVTTWEQSTGRAAGDLTWFVTLAIWKLAVLLEASYHRYLAGSTDDPFFGTLEHGVPALLAHARDTSRG
jgi:aminoglycoside phosphotransferase (APT) family kinase protein